MSVKQSIYYNGHEIILENCQYKIRGFLAISFTSLEAVKRHIDWMKLDRPHNQTTLYL